MSTLFIQQQGQGQPLVLLHGWGFSQEIWAPVLPVLSQHYQITLIDLPGHGRSPFLPAFNDIHLLAHYLMQNTPANAIWLGWSLGGLIALALAQHYPTHIQQLLQVATTPKFVANRDWLYGIKPHNLAQFEQQLQTNPDATLTRFVALQVLGLSTAKKDIRKLTACVQKNLPTADGLNWGLHLLHTLDLRSYLASVSCPIHYLLGAKDSMVPFALQNYLAQNHSHIAVEVLAAAAHMPFFSHPELFIKWLTHATNSRTI